MERVRRIVCCLRILGLLYPSYDRKRRSVAINRLAQELAIQQDSLREEPVI